MLHLVERPTEILGHQFLRHTFKVVVLQQNSKCRIGKGYTTSQAKFRGKQLYWTTHVRNPIPKFDILVGAIFGGWFLLVNFILPIFDGK